MPKSLKVQELLLEDGAGRVRARIHVSAQGRPVIDVLDTEGRPLRTLDLMEASVAPAPAKTKASLRKESTLEEWHLCAHQEVLASHGKPVNSYKLYIDFMEDYNSASSKYINEILVVSGDIVDIQIREFGDMHVGLKGLSNYNAEVLCHFLDSQMDSVQRLKPGQRVKIRGKCTEYVNKRVKLWGCVVAEAGQHR